MASIIDFDYEMRRKLTEYFEPYVKYDSQPGMLDENGVLTKEHAHKPMLAILNSYVQQFIASTGTADASAIKTFIEESVNNFKLIMKNENIPLHSSVFDRVEVILWDMYMKQ
mgnify:CR=1 FL=1